MDKAPNTSTPASQPPQGSQPAPQGAAAAGTPAQAPAPAVSAPFGVKTATLKDLGYPGQEPKPAAGAPADGKPAQPAPNANAQAPGTDGAPDPEAGKPGADDGKPAAGKELVAENGRKFSTLEDAVKTYNESTKEARRLADVEKFVVPELNTKLDAANQTILAMQEYIGAGVYPNTKTAEELGAMDEEAKQEYYADKRDWKKRVEGFKGQMENAKAESEKTAKALKGHQDQVQGYMENNPDEFPGYTELKPGIAKILADVPELGRMPNGAYIAHVIAMGDTYITYLKETAKQTAASKKKAADEAGANAATVGGGNAPAAGGAGGGSKKPTAHDELMERTAAAHNKRTKVF